MEHTKGKWSVSSATIVCDESARIIANCCPIGIPELDTPLLEAITNARLIAAAPDLLEACKAGLKFLDSLPNSYYLCAKQNKEAATSIFAKAIAKAEKQA